MDKEYKIKTGKNALQNWELLESYKNHPNFLFFHLSSFPSCFVIWENDEENPKKEDIEKVARVCLENTKYKKIKGIKVDYTRIGNVKRGDKPGEIYYISERKVKPIKLD